MSENNNNIDSSEVIHIHSQIVCSSFNADGSCVCIGTKSSFSIYNTNPATKRFTSSKQGGLRVIELHYNSALVACVPTGEKAGVSPRKLILFDCIQNKKLSELAFPSTIRMCHMNNENLLVILDSQLYIYDIWSLALMTLIEIEKGGYVSLSTGVKSVLSAPIPSNNVGCISIFEYSRSEVKKLCDIQAHKNKIASSYISTSGHLIATCSSNGTLVKVFSTVDGVLIGTYRRGFHHVFVNSISICPNDEYLSVGSSSGTVHIFAIKSNNIDDNTNTNHNAMNHERLSTNSRNSTDKSTNNHHSNNNTTTTTAFGYLHSTIGTITYKAADLVWQSNLIPKELKQAMEPQRAEYIVRVPGSESHFKAMLSYDRISNSNKNKPKVFVVTNSGYLYRFKIPSDLSKFKDESHNANDPIVCLLEDEHSLLDL